MEETNRMTPEEMFVRGGYTATWLLEKLKEKPEKESLQVNLTAFGIAIGALAGTQKISEQTLYRIFGVILEVYRKSYEPPVAETLED